ncbi:hypothetical protein ACRRTK_005199 [Alexandromys fortis]
MLLTLRAPGNTPDLLFVSPPPPQAPCPASSAHSLGLCFPTSVNTKGKGCSSPKLPV